MFDYFWFTKMPITVKFTLLYVTGVLLKLQFCKRYELFKKGTIIKKMILLLSILW